MTSLLRLALRHTVLACCLQSLLGLRLFICKNNQICLNRQSSAKRSILFNNRKFEFDDLGFYKKSIKNFVAFSLGIFPFTLCMSPSFALNMGTLFEREEVIVDEDKADIFGIVKDFMEKTSDDDDELLYQSQDTELLINDRESTFDRDQVQPDDDENISARKNTDEKSLPPIALKLFDSVLNTKDKNSLKKTLFGTGQDDLTAGAGVLTEKGLEPKDSPPAGLPSIEFLEEKAMFEEVIGEVRQCHHYILRIITTCPAMKLLPLALLNIYVNFDSKIYTIYANIRLFFSFPTAFLTTSLQFSVFLSISYKLNFLLLLDHEWRRLIRHLPRRFNADRRDRDSSLHHGCCSLLLAEARDRRRDARGMPS